jgi:hypothetical protein
MNIKMLCILSDSVRLNQIKNKNNKNLKTKAKLDDEGRRE